MTDYYIEDGVSEELKQLAWKTFFVSKERGVSFERHFPWIKTEQNIWSVEARVFDKVVAGLIIRECKIARNSSEHIVGCVGLVCVDPDYRGNGVAGKMFETLIESAFSRNYDALTLWTSQHHIYQSHGFVVHDKTQYGTVIFPEDEVVPPLEYETEELSKNVGLPAFSHNGNLYKRGGTEVSVVWDDNGGVVVDWTGDDASVISLFKSIFPKSFRINTRVGNSIINALHQQKTHTNVSNANLQMWLPLNNFISISELESLYEFNVLNRI